MDQIYVNFKKVKNEIHHWITSSLQEKR